MPKLSEVLDGSATALLTIAPLLPTNASINEVVNQLSPAIARGYFTPEEDELIEALVGRSGAMVNSAVAEPSRTSDSFGILTISLGKQSEIRGLPS